MRDDQESFRSVESRASPSITKAKFFALGMEDLAQEFNVVHDLPIGVPLPRAAMETTFEPYLSRRQQWLVSVSRPST